jgi:hypothetical protein
MMARKKLLTESEIRRFMKLANMGVIGDSRIEGISLQEQPMDLGDEEVEMDTEVEMEPEAPVEDELSMDEPVEDEMGMEMGGEGLQVSLDDFMTAFAGALEDATGEEVSIEMGDLEGEEEVDLEGGEETLDVSAEEDLGEPGGMDVGAEEEELEMPGGRDSYQENQNKVVREVARRVAARLVKENKKADMVDALTERVFKRLTRK